MKNIPVYRRLSRNRKNVLADMAMNLGIGGLLAFKRTLAALSAGDFMLASRCMSESKWFGQVGNRAKRLCAMMEQDKAFDEVGI
jgi:lysozyme